MLNREFGENVKEISDRTFLFGVVTLGCTCLVTQTILLREFLVVFCGNELVIGIVLANWMMLTGAGSLVGKYARHIRHSETWIVVLLFAIAVLPCVTVFLLDWSRNIIFPVGGMVGLIGSFSSSAVLLAPLCFVSGFLFSLFVLVVSNEQLKHLIATVYAVEALGSVVGGLVFNLVLVFVLTTFESLFLLALLNLTALSFILAKLRRRMALFGATLLAVVLSVVMFTCDIDSMARQSLFADQELFFHKDTPYGNLAVTKQGEQLNFFENSSLLFSTNDPTANEEAVHYAMVQHPDPKHVLLVSGGISGTTQEILKYGVERIDYVEINPALIDIGMKFTTSLVDRRIHVINQDARRFVRTTGAQYDVALINVPDPSNAQINRYFTIEFIRDLKQRLNSCAVLSLSLLPSVDYYGGEARQISSIMYNTMKTAFHNVLIIPGFRNFYVASDCDLHRDIARMIAQRNIPTTYVNQFYLDDASMRQRSDDIVRKIDRGTAINEDFAPIAYYRQLLYWLSYFRLNPWHIGAALVVVLLAMGTRLNTITVGMFTGGFAASSVEMVLILSFQTMEGYVYQATGLIITVFMAGLAAGSFVRQRQTSRNDIGSYIIVQFCIGTYAVFLPAILYSLKNRYSGDLIVYSVFGLLMFTIAALVGREFALGTRLLKGGACTVASTLYGVDLIGSALGAFIISVFLVPLLGIVNASFMVALLNFASATIGISHRKQFAVSSTGKLFYVR